MGLRSNISSPAAPRMIRWAVEPFRNDSEDGDASGRRNWTTLKTRTPARASASTTRVARCGAPVEDLLAEARSEREDEPGRDE